MSTQIEYRNNHGKKISPQQLEVAKEFTKVFIENGVLKKEEFYENKRILYVNYYVSSNEDVTELIDNYSSQTSLTIIDTEFHNSYRIENSKTYETSILLFQSRELYDSNNFLICDQDIYIQSGLPKIETTRKFYENDDDMVYIDFSYDENGDINIVTPHTKVSIYDNSQDLNLFNVWFPDFLSENPYYADATFLP